MMHNERARVAPLDFSFKTLCCKANCGGGGLRPAAAQRPPSGGGLRWRPAAAACGAAPPAVPPCGAALRRRPASKVSARSAQNLSSLRPHAAAFEVRLEHGHLAIVEENSRECCRPWCPSTARSPCPSTARSPPPRKPERPLLRFVADAPHGSLQAACGRAGIVPSAMNRRHWQ